MANLQNGDSIELIKFGSDFYYIDGNGAYTLFPTGSSSSTASYLVYTALLTQSATDAPTGIELQNTLDSDITYAYDAEGSYDINSSEAIFDVNKTFIISSPSISNNAFVSFSIEILSTTNIRIQTFNSSQVEANGLLLNTPIEIRVYP